MTPTQYNDEIDEILEPLLYGLKVHHKEINNSHGIIKEVTNIEFAKKRLQTLIKQAEVRAEIKAHERYDTVPVKNLRQHMIARKNILEAQLNNLEG